MPSQNCGLFEVIHVAGIIKDFDKNYIGSNARLGAFIGGAIPCVES